MTWARHRCIKTLSFICVVLGIYGCSDSTTAVTIYTEHCVQCHGADYKGDIGPSLDAAAMKTIGYDRAYNTIENGLLGSQMPGFGQRLTPRQIDELVVYLSSTQTVKLKVNDVALSDVSAYETDLSLG